MLSGVVTVGLFNKYPRNQFNTPAVTPQHDQKRSYSYQVTLMSIFTEYWSNNSQEVQYSREVSSGRSWKAAAVSVFEID